MAFFGSIFTGEITSSSPLNNVLGGIVDNVLGGGVNVALSSEMGQDLLNSLGLDPAVAPQNFVSSVLTPGILATGGEAINQALTDSLVKSGALGPFGNLVTDVVTNVTGSLTQELLGSFLPEGLTRGMPTKYFAGAGGEEDANYGGYVYTPGPVGPDIVFTIKPAQNAASAGVQAQVSGNGSGVASVFDIGQSFTSGGNPFPYYLTTDLATGSLGSLFEGGTTFWDGGLMLPDNLRYGTNEWGSPLNFGTINQSGYVIPEDFFAYSFNPNLTLGLGYTPQVGSQSFFDTSALNFAGFQSPINLYNFSNIGQTPGNPNQEPVEGGWKFTTAPGDVTWDTSAKVERVNIFGTNQAPVISGTRGMKELSMSNALIEGFSMGKSVEKKIAKLESLLNFTLTSSYVKVPVYWVAAADKKYGFENGDGGYFVIKQIKVKEELRDLSGNTTRAMVDVSFTQVPPYQVDDGRDLASQSVAGASSLIKKSIETQALNDKQVLEKAKQLLPAQQPQSPSQTSRPGNSGTGSASGAAPTGDAKVGTETVLIGGSTRIPRFIARGGNILEWNGSSYEPIRK